MKAYTSQEQSKKLAEILPFESADMFYSVNSLYDEIEEEWKVQIGKMPKLRSLYKKYCPCWSLAALLNFIKDKCGYYELVYLSSTFDGRANRLENVHRLSTDIYDVYENELIDACVEMILKLHELNLL